MNRTSFRWLAVGAALAAGGCAKPRLDVSWNLVYPKMQSSPANSDGIIVIALTNRNRRPVTIYDVALNEPHRTLPLPVATPNASKPVKERRLMPGDILLLPTDLLKKNDALPFTCAVPVQLYVRARFGSPAAAHKSVRQRRIVIDDPIASALPDEWTSKGGCLVPAESDAIQAVGGEADPLER